MKLIKKVAAFTVILSILLTGVHVAADNQQATSSEQDIALLIATGVLYEEDAKADPSGLVSRAEFAMTAVRLQGLEDIASNWTSASTFTDTDPEFFETPYVIIAASSGIMEAVEPDRFGIAMPVTFSQAIKTLITILGYDSPYHDEEAYISLAVNKGLLKGVTIGEGTINRGSIYKMICNSLEIELGKTNVYTFEEYGAIKEKTINPNSDFAAPDKATILTVYHKIFMRTGIVEANSVTHLTDRTKNAVTGEIVIDAISYSMEKIQDEDLLGYSVKLYYKEEKGKNIIVYLSKHKNEVLIIQARDIQDCDPVGKEYTYYENEKSRAVSFKDANIIVNGKAITGDGVDLSPDVGRVTLIDNNGDSKYDVLIVISFVEIIVKSVTTDPQGTTTIYGDFGKYFEIKSDSTVRVFVAPTLKEAALSAVTAGSVLLVSAAAQDEYIEIIMCTDVVSGAIAENVQGEDAKLLIEGEYYKLSFDLHNLIKSGRLDDFRLGTPYTFYLNGYGEIALYDAGPRKLYGDYEFAVLVAGALEGGAAYKLKIKLFTTSGEMTVHEVAEGVHIDEIKQKGPEDAYKKLCLPDGGNIMEFNPQLVRVKVDGDNVVTHIDLAGERSASEEALYEAYNGINTFFGYYAYHRHFGQANVFPRVVFNNPVYVFQVPMLFTSTGKSFDSREFMSSYKIDVTDDSLFVASGAAGLTNGTRYRYIGYRVDPNGVGLDAILAGVELDPNTKKPVKVLTGAPPLCIYRGSSRAIENDEEVTKIYFNELGKEKTAILDRDLDINTIAVREQTTVAGGWVGGVYALKKGDLFCYGTDSKGRINYLVPGYDAENDKMLRNSTQPVPALNLLDTQWRSGGAGGMYLERVHVTQIDDSYVLFLYNEPESNWRTTMNEGSWNLNDPETIVVGNRNLVKWIVYPRTTIFGTGVFIYNKLNNTVVKATDSSSGLLVDYETSPTGYTKGFLWRENGIYRGLVLYE